MKIAEWSNTTILAFGREWDISVRGEFNAQARLDPADPKKVRVTVRHWDRGRERVFVAEKVQASEWVFRGEKGETLLTVRTPGDEWPWRLRAGGIMLWLRRNGR